MADCSATSTLALYAASPPALPCAVWPTFLTMNQGIPPTTLAEWTLSASSGLDYYDVSLVSGYNLPMAITPSVPAGSSCPAPACAVDLGPPCPPALAGPYDTSGFPLGCKAACEVDPDPRTLRKRYQGEAEG